MSDLQRLSWFGGDQDALNMYLMIGAALNTWDDLVDKDKDVSELQINNAFLTCLVYLPANPFYRRIQEQVMPMWMTVVSAYETANKFERDKDAFGLEIAHGLRSAVGHIIAYALHQCVGPNRAREVMPDVWKDIFAERMGEYLKEHLNAV